MPTPLNRKISAKTQRIKPFNTTWRGATKAYTLVEVIIVILIISVILTLSLPNMLRSKITNNETEAITGCKVISNSCQMFRLRNIPQRYPVDGAGGLAELEAGGYIDASFLSANQPRKGYNYTYANPKSGGAINETYRLEAAPVTANVTGVRWFRVEEDGILRASQDAGANWVIVE